MEHRDTYLRALRHALAMAGGPVFLAARLGVGLRQLRGWLRGEGAIPDEVFLRAVDVIESGYTPVEGRRWSGLKNSTSG